jgi:ferredoxin
MEATSGGYDDFRWLRGIEVMNKSVRVHINHKTTIVECRVGDTVLEAARRSALYPPFSCRRGECGTCRALLEVGTVEMRTNNYLTALDVKDGWILTCQAVPSSQETTVNYEARRWIPGLRSLLRTAIDTRLRRKQSISSLRAIATERTPEICNSISPPSTRR